MSRRGPSPADLSLIARVAAAGNVVTATQLERWRARHWIPKNSQHGSGRGNGSSSEFDPRIVAWVSALGSATGAGRRGRHVLVAAYMQCVAGGETESLAAAENEPVLRAAMLQILDRIVPPSTGDVTDAAIDRAYVDAQREAASGPALHPHLMEDVHNSLAGVDVPSRRSAIADSRSALVQLAVATRYPGVVDDRLIVESFAGLGILPDALIEELRAKNDVIERDSDQGSLAALLLPDPDRLRSAISNSTTEDLNAAAALAVGFMALRGWLTMLSISNADDPVVVGMKLALGLRDSAFITIALGPREFVVQLSALLANPTAMPSIADRVSAAYAVLVADENEEPLVHRHLRALERLAGQTPNGGFADVRASSA